jgi:polyphosphate kinase
LARLQDIPEQIPYSKFKYKLIRQKNYFNDKKNIFQQIKSNDILIHHPYDSFENYLNYIQSAFKDPNVLAIKQTIYRVAGNSKMMQLLIDCAKRGIAVTVVVELLARFDEEANINWAEQLEAYGVNVVYGVVGYKTHAKMSMIIRREGRRLSRYVHLGTGNYHEKTSKLYSDFGIFTANYQLCSEVDDVFNQITSMGKPKKHKLILQSPFSLHSGLINHINNSIKNKNKKNNFIIFKANSLIEPKIIEKLYEASNAGVKIYLIIRGACALRPGVINRSLNIEVVSIIGRFLEHHRCYYFSVSDTLYLSSADCMERNFFRRYELAFPILDKNIRNYLVSILNMFLKDNENSYKLLSNGNYVKIKNKKKSFSIHDYLLNT